MRRIASCLGTIVLNIFAQPLWAEDGVFEVDMELVLAVDISFSISMNEQDIQRRGYVAAFLDPEVVMALTQGTRGRVAVTYLEWAGETSHAQVIPWTLISDRESAAAFSERLNNLEINRSGRTSLSGALDMAADLLGRSPFVSYRQVVDLSSDGMNNSGLRVDKARDRLIYRGITINGLPLLVGTKGGPAENLDVYFEDCVIGGLGAFNYPVYNWESFGETLQRKLVRELAGYPGPAQARICQAADVTQAPTKMDCLTGERAELENFKALIDTIPGGAERWKPVEKDWIPED